MIARASSSVSCREIVIPVSPSIPAVPQSLTGMLTLPEVATSVVIFGCGFGQFCASRVEETMRRDLNLRGMGTLVIDLLTEDERRSGLAGRYLNGDLDQSTSRFVEVIDWLRLEGNMHSHPIGLFGSGIGAAAALRAAVRRSRAVSAVVSVNGRPDLAGDYLSEVRIPTLLLVGEDSRDAIYFNETAREMIRGRVRLELVPEAEEMLEDRESLEKLSRQACNWFQQHLCPEPQTRPCFPEEETGGWLTC